MLTLDPAFYFSSEPEMKDLFGPKIVNNTIKCDGFNFFYSTNIVAQRISDNENISITNFLTPVNGATTSGDYRY